MWSGAPRTYTDVSNYTGGAMILDLVDTRTNKLVFRGAGAAVSADRKATRARFAMQ